jgi:hypothetical protein
MEMEMTDAPHLTRQRWSCLIALRKNKVLQRREFLARELQTEWRGKMRPASGATMHSLREAGWVEQVVIGGRGEGLPFRSGGPAKAWRVTEAGQKAIDACPDTFPGEPVYKKDG